MIEIVASVDKKGLLRTCSVKGHANQGAMGEDVVCAAISVLSQTAVNVLSRVKNIVFRAEAPRRGELYFEVAAPEASGEAFLAAAGAFLLEGFRSVCADYPVNCKLNIVEFVNL
jgi:uncharacterized protein YsxB (DUF464 family)